MSELLLPPSVIAEKEQAEQDELEAQKSATFIAAAENARQQFQMSLASAYRAGFELASTTPRRLQVQLNVGQNFWRWYEAEVAL